VQNTEIVGMEIKLACTQGKHTTSIIIILLS